MKLTPLGEGDTSGFDDSTTWQLDPMPMATKMQIPRNSAIGARMSSLREKGGGSVSVGDGMITRSKWGGGGTYGILRRMFSLEKEALSGDRGDSLM